MSEKENNATNVNKLVDGEGNNTSEKITSLGIRFWDGLCIFMFRTELFTTEQKDDVTTITRKLKRDGEFIDTEIEKGGEIIDILQQNNIEFKTIEALSLLKPRETVGPIVIYERLKAISKNDWIRVFAIGEQTQKITYNEVSVVKTVQSKIKNKESIDLNRLQIANEYLDRVRKFGVNV